MLLTPSFPVPRQEQGPRRESMNYPTPLPGPRRCLTPLPDPGRCSFHQPHQITLQTRSGLAELVLKQTSRWHQQALATQNVSATMGSFLPRGWPGRLCGWLLPSPVQCSWGWSPDSSSPERAQQNSQLACFNQSTALGIAGSLLRGRRHWGGGVLRAPFSETWPGPHRALAAV